MSEINTIKMKKKTYMKIPATYQQTCHIIFLSPSTVGMA